MKCVICRGYGWSRVFVIQWIWMNWDKVYAEKCINSEKITFQKRPERRRRRSVE